MASLPVVDTKKVAPDLDGTCNVTVAEADFVGSACETAVTETVAGLGTADGPRYRASFDVPGTVVETRPMVELPPLTPLTCQVTAVLALPLTVAVNGCVAKVAKVALDGEMVTLTCALAGVGSAANKNRTPAR